MTGKTILHYRILEKIGEGGMGQVYKAEDTKLERTVAIKFLPPQIAADSEERERFKIEAKAAAALNHPNIATIYAIEDTDDEMFIVMEFIEGKELKEIIRNSKFVIRNCLDYATQIASGLKAAHEKDVTHRDIKTANIMVTDKGQVKIMDFGLAKVRGGAQVTKLGTTLGTAAYMSPEQAQGLETDHRTDIWAFGVVLYEMLTGELPFGGDYEQAVIYSILNEEPKPISASGTGVPENLQGIINKCLAKEAANRYPNGEDLLVDLQQVQGGQKSKVLHQAEARRTVPLMGRAVRFGGLSIFILIVIAGYFFLGRQPAVSARLPIAVVDFINQTNEPALDGLSGMLITALEQSRRLAVVSRARMYDEYKQMNRPDLTFVDETTGREISKRANIQALAVATIRNFDNLYAIDFKVIDPQTGDRLFSTKVEGEGKKSIPGLLDELSDRTRIDLKERAEDVQLSRQGVADVTTPNLEAYHHYFKGQELLDKLDFAKAKEEFRKAIALDSTFGLAHYRLQYAMSWFSESGADEQLKVALRHIDRIPEKERFLVRAQQVREEQGFAASVEVLKQMEARYPNEKEMLFNIGDYAFHADDFETALTYFDKVLALDPNHERTRFHYGDAFTSRFLNSATSKSDLEAVLAKAQQVRKQRPEFTEWRRVLGKLYIGLEQYGWAEAEFLQYIEDSQSDFSQLTGKLQLLATYAYKGEYEKLFKISDDEIKTRFASADTSVAVSWTIAKGIFTMGLSDKAALNTIIGQLLPFQKRVDVPFVNENLGAFMTAAGRFSEALEMQKNARNPNPALAMALGGCEKGTEILEQLRDVTAVPSSLKVWMFYGLAKCQFAAGEFEEAERNVLESQRLHFLPNNIAFVLSYRAITYPRTYLLLGRISEAQGKTTKAIEYYEKFLDLWKNADTDLPELIEAKQQLAALKG